MSMKWLLGQSPRPAPDSARPGVALGDTRFLPAPEAADLKAIYAWWDALRAGNAMPRKSALTPHDLKPFLPKIQLIEVVDGGRDYRIRIFGSEWVHATGWDFTDRLLSQTINQPVKDKWMTIYGRVVETAAPLSFVTNLNNVGRSFIYVEELLLPFSRDTERVEFLLAAITRRV